MAHQNPSFLKRLFDFISVVSFVLIVWKLCMVAFEPPSYVFPSPESVFLRFKEQPFYLLSNAWITLKEMMLGFIIGSIIGALLAVLLAQFKILERFLMPLVTLMPNLPVFAIAPLLVVWFGFGLSSKVIMTTLIILFPVASSFYDGLKTTPQMYLDLCDSWGASRWQKLIHAQIPAALPSLMSGLKVAATIAPIGAIVGEWVGAAGGLGFVIIQANARIQVDMVFAAIVLIGFAAFILRWLVVELADRIVWWPKAVI